MGRGTPMTPVDATTTSSREQPTAAAVAGGHLPGVLQALASPVAALAQPAFTTTACARPRAGARARPAPARPWRGSG